MKPYRASARALAYKNSKFSATAKASVARNLRGTLPLLEERSK